MNTKTPNSLRAYQIFFVALGVVCAAAIATNLVIRRVPVHDASAESDISAIYGAIDSYVSTQGRLPTNLADVSGLSSATQKRLGDYDYQPGASYSYQICATFQGAGKNTAKPYINTPAPGYSDPSRHGTGRTCFSYTAQPYNNGPVGKPIPQAQ